MRDRSEESRPLKYSFVYFVTTCGSLAIVRGKDNNFQSFIFVRVIYSSLPDKRKAWLSEECSGKDIDHSVHSVNRYEKLWILVSRQPIAILEDIKCENLCKNLRIRVIEESRLELTSPPLQFLYHHRDFGWRDSRLGDTEEEKNELLFDRPAIYGWNIRHYNASKRGGGRPAGRLVGSRPRVCFVWKFNFSN